MVSIPRFVHINWAGEVNTAMIFFCVSVLGAGGGRAHSADPSHLVGSIMFIESRDAPLELKLPMCFHVNHLYYAF